MAVLGILGEAGRQGVTVQVGVVGEHALGGIHVRSRVLSCGEFISLGIWCDIGRSHGDIDCIGVGRMAVAHLKFEG